MKVRLLPPLLVALLLNSCTFVQQTASQAPSEPCAAEVVPPPGAHFMNPLWQFDDDICVLDSVGEWDCMTFDAVRKIITGKKFAE